ncbi:MAG TPA: F0F1 ATP synthase subunit B [Patescibacteria group bacterium]|nr:F0F1 ATP synthase subunit B [Patescibacteria group bacterium]
MNSLIQALGLDLRILLAQLFNFALLIFILWRFAYKPIFNILEERRQKIAKGIADADEAGLRLQKSTEESKDIISNSRREASDIIEDAQKKAELKYQEIVASAQGDIEKQSALEVLKIKKEKESLMTEVKTEVSGLVVLSLEKFLKEKMDSEKDEKIIEKIVKELS